MRLLTCSLLFVMACGGGGDDGYPIKPGGGDGTGTDGSGDGVTDAGPDGPATQMVTGSVCVLVDSTSFDGCRATGLAGIEVQIGGSTAITNDAGGFSIMKPSASATFWTLTTPTGGAGIKIVSSIVPYTADLQLRTMELSRFDSIAAASMITQSAGAATVFVQVVDGDANGVAGALLAAPAASTIEPVRYGSADDTWSVTGPTLEAGTAWLTNVNPTTGKVDITATLGASELQPQAVKVVASYVTFALLPTASQ